MDHYKINVSTLDKENKRLAKIDKQYSYVRLILALAGAVLFYRWLQTSEVFLLFICLLIVIAFLLLVRKHEAIRWENVLVKKKIQLNQDELSYLESGKLSFANGIEFQEHDHPYTYDLDFFGEHSLFQLLNRTHTVTGKGLLAKTLQNHSLNKEAIEEHQVAIKELTPEIVWRQHFQAIAAIDPDTLEDYERLMEWGSSKPSLTNKLSKVLSFLLPTITITFLLGYSIVPEGFYGNLAALSALINLGFLAIHMMSIKQELIATTNIEKTLKHYSYLLKSIENQSFKSKNLIQLQNRLGVHDAHPASKAIHDLSLLFGRLEHVSNVFASPILNGLFLYHIHVMRGLSSWRKEFALHMKDWLEVIGQFETYNSLANFSYNHPSYEFPTINKEFNIQFDDLGHPMLASVESVTNSISFTKHRFFILTGSNMSGKSTFLRTLGVNMVLGSIGAPVYAKKATIHPLPLFVSMRLSDSLSDSESYFYAEVKRLKYIMDHLENDACFVLLDEILRGTNSDDKRNGTIEVIRKMANKNAFGGIATHDLEVCKVTKEFPDTLINKRFEATIANNELVFDYQLQNGICENKSASFIMKKMGII